MIRRKLAAGRQFGRWVRSRLVGTGLILLYHRISNPGLENDFDPFGLCVTPNHFAEHLDAIRQFGNPISLRSMVEGVRQNTLPPRAIAVTFDDGYADNLYQASPLLDKYEVPTTVFVVSGSLGGSFWWDDLARIVLRPRRLPKQLELVMNAQTVRWRVGTLDRVTRLRLLKHLQRLLRVMPVEDRQLALTRLAHWSNAALDNNDASSPMKPSELRALAECDLVEIGAHSVTHPPLRFVPLQQQLHEVQQSKTELETVLARPVTSFSYPYGLNLDFSRETVQIVKEVGFDCACTNEVGAIWSGSEAFQLPRIWVNDVSGDEFAYRIKNWLPRRPSVPDAGNVS